MHSATIIIPLSKEEALKMIQEFLTILCPDRIAVVWLGIGCRCAESVDRVYDDCGSGGQEMCLLML